MSHREDMMAFFRGENIGKTIFAPDISDWYSTRRTQDGKEMRFGCGQFIADDDPFNKQQASMPEEYRDFTYLDFYRNFGWALPVHIYDWCGTEYDGVREICKRDGDIMEITLETSLGSLRKVRKLAAGGTWATTEEYVKNLDDLKIMQFVVEHSTPVPNYAKIQNVLDQVGELGVVDMYIHRSPFGKLIQEYMGFEQTVYALFENPDILFKFMEIQEQYDMQVVELAAKAPAQIVYLADHADENLISPPFYKDYCIPFYQKMCEILHASNKIVSTHLDGNFRGYFSYLADTHVDYLDGCTPAPMSNYEAEDLAAALPANMRAYCGVPSTLFTQDLPDETIVSYAERIVNASDRFVLNVGDLLPGKGDLEQVVKMGAWVEEKNGVLTKAL